MTKVTMPDLTIDMPNTRFWKAVALDVRKNIRERTETKKVDVSGKAFRPYNKVYAWYRTKKGRSTRPNLSFTGKMLGSMKDIGRKNKAIVRLSGEQGFKAWANEENGREFFDLSLADTRKIFTKVDSFMKRTNNLR